MSTLLSVPHLPTEKSYPSFEAFSKNLNQAHAIEGIGLKFSFPQILCLKAFSSQLITQSLTPEDPFFQPVQEVLEKLGQKMKVLTGAPEIAILEKIEAAYRAFIEEACQTSGERRVQLLDVNHVFVRQLIEHNQAVSMQELIDQKQKVAIHIPDKNGLTPLHIAAGEGNVNMVDLLLKAGADIEAQDQNNRTPLHYAALKGQVETAYELIVQGASILCIDINGDMPLDVALRFKQDKWVLRLMDPAQAKMKSRTHGGVEDQDLEGAYYKCFEEAYHQGEGLEMIFYLQKMSALYLEKENWAVAAHLLNNALALAVRFSVQESYQLYLVRKLENIEIRYMQKFFKLAIPADYQGYLKAYRQDLIKIRERVQEQLIENVAPQHIQRELTRRLQQLFVRLIEDSLYFMQEKPPTPFAIIGLGSMSREEMSPYSDIEFAILIHKDTPENRDYFRRLSRLIEIRMVNLGETKYDLIRPRQIGHYSVSAESFTPHGFSLDVGGLFPLGKSGIYELIGTPQELARFQTDQWLAQNEGEIILVNAMTACCLIKGNSSLVQTYQTHVQRLLDQAVSQSTTQKIREKRALDLLKGHVEEFKPFLEASRLHLRAFDVKKDFYRPIQMVIGALGLYYGLKSQNTLALLQELEQRNLVGATIAQTLRETLTQILTLRLRTHLFYQNEKEIVYYSQGYSDLEAEGLYLIKAESDNIILEIYRVLVPLQTLAHSFVQGNRQAFIEASCYDETFGRASQEPEANLSHEEVERRYLQRAILSPNNPDALDDLQRIKMMWGKPQEALEYNLKRLAILKRELRNRSHSSIARTLYDLGMCCYHLEEHQQAISYYEQSLMMWKDIYDRQPRVKIANCLTNQGKAYLSLGERRNAMMCLERSSAIISKQIDSFEARPKVVLALQDLGRTYRDLGEHQQAIDHYQQSLDLCENMYGDTSHPVTVDVLFDLGFAYSALKEVALIIIAYEKGLEMCRQIYTQHPHPQMALVLYNLGVAYELLGELSTAITHYEQGFNLSKEIYQQEPNMVVTQLLLALGDGYMELKEVKRAITYYQQILPLHQNQANDHLVRACCALGGAYLILKNVPKTISYYEKSWELYEQIGEGLSHSEGISLLTNLGVSYQALGNVQKAVHFLERSLTMARQLYAGEDRFHPIIVDILNLLAHSCYHPEYVQIAITCYQELLGIHQHTHGNSPHEDVIEVLNGLGASCVCSGDTQQAITYYEQSLALNRQIHGNKLHPDLTYVLNHLVHLYASLRDSEKEMAYYDQIIALDEGEAEQINI